MSKRTIIILIAVVIVVAALFYLMLADMGISIFSGHKENSTFSRIIWFSVSAVLLIPVLVILTAYNPRTTIYSILHLCRNAKGYEKENGLKRYVSAEFLNSSQFGELVKIPPVGVSRLTQERQGKDVVVTVTYKDNQVYHFTLTKRNPQVDRQTVSGWLVKRLEVE